MAGKIRHRYEYEYIDTVSLDTQAPLPQHIVDVLKVGLGSHKDSDNRKKAYAYIHDIRKAGWKLDAIAKSLGVTREWIRIICVRCENERDSWGVSVDGWEIPPIPTKVTTTKRKKHIPPIPTEKIQELKSLHQESFLVRGNLSPTHPRRIAAENYLKKILELREQGYTNYAIAKSLGVSVGAVSNRLIRYGFAPTIGKSKAVRQINPQNRNININQTTND